jgi:hypothetical protein
LTEKGVKEQFSDFSDALGGDSGDTNSGSKSCIADTSLSTFKPDAIDIGIAKDGNKARIYMFGQTVRFSATRLSSLTCWMSGSCSQHRSANQSGLIHTVRLDEGMASTPSS